MWGRIKAGKRAGSIPFRVFQALGDDQRGAGARRLDQMRGIIQSVGVPPRMAADYTGGRRVFVGVAPRRTKPGRGRLPFPTFGRRLRPGLAER